MQLAAMTDTDWSWAQAFFDIRPDSEASVGPTDSTTLRPKRQVSDKLTRMEDAGWTSCLLIFELSEWIAVMTFMVLMHINGLLNGNYGHIQNKIISWFSFCKFKNTYEFIMDISS
jgi:hypothetical protein